MKNPLVHLGAHTFWYGIGQVLNRFISFLLLPVLTAYLDPADYGVISNLALVGFVMIPLLSLGFDAAAGPCYFEGNSRADKEATIWTEAILLAMGAVVLAGMSWRGADPAADWLFAKPGYGGLLQMWMWGCCIEMMVIPCRHYLMFEQHVKLLTALNLASTLATMGITLLMVIGQRKGLMGMVEARTYSLVGSGVLFYGVVAPLVRFRWSASKARALLRVGLLFMPTILLLALLQHGNKYLLQYLRGLEEAGLYSVGFNFGLVMAVPVTAFQTAWYPFFMSYMDRPEEARVLFGRILTYYVLGFGCLCILFFLAARPVIHVMTQAPFHGAWQAVGLTALGQYLIGVYYALLPGMYLAKEPHAQSPILAAGTLLALGLNYWLIVGLGMLGAGVALALGAFGLDLITHAWNRWRGHAYLQVQYEWKRLALFAGLLAGYAIVSLMQTEGSFVGETMGALALALPLPVLLYALLRPDERQALRHFLQGKAITTSPHTAGPPLKV